MAQQESIELTKEQLEDILQNVVMAYIKAVQKFK